ncbi:disease resistance protein rpp13 [Hordeum vulgare]|nr:disease resistance protein rpp13 [Hordeum vulgare]
MHGATAPPSKLLHGLAKELMNVLTTSAQASLQSKHMAYSMMAASQGSMILPSLPPAKPNSSWDIARNSLKTDVPRIKSEGYIDSSVAATWELNLGGVPQIENWGSSNRGAGRVVPMARIACSGWNGTGWNRFWLPNRSPLSLRLRSIVPPPLLPCCSGPCCSWVKQTTID